MNKAKEDILKISFKSFQYTFKDKRKLIGFILILFLPLLSISWRFVPEDATIVYYDSLQTFIYLFSLNFSITLIAIAWFFTIPRRDFAMQIIAMAAVFYGVFMVIDTIPHENPSSMWIDVILSFFVFIIACIYLFYIHRNYVNRAIDYKQLHDGIVHDLHHERFLNEISRIEGLIDIAEMDEPYKSLCEKEIARLRESVAYIADKYSELK